MFGGNNSFNTFGAQNAPAQAGGLFGAPKPVQGGLFGAQPQQQQNTGGLFGNPQNVGGAFGNQQQQQPNAFMQQPQQQGQGLFGGNQQSNTGGLFGNQPQQQTQGIFGSQPQQQTQGIFGNQQQPQQNTGLFGGQQQQQGNTMGGGLFGGQQAQGTGIFGGATQQQGTGLFGGNQQQQGAGLFGGNQQQQPQANNLFGNTQPTGTGLFGAASNTANNAFLGQQPQQPNPFNVPNTGFGNNTTSIFGGAQQQAQPGNSIFGGNQPQQQSTNTGGLFNTFAPNQQQQQPGIFQQQQQPANTGNSLFGNASFSNPASTSNNKLGGTSWGVPTNLASAPSNPSVGTQVQPVKSKNSKLDAKHLVKCIAALDQFNGLSKEEIRISFIQSGGQQPAITQQQPTANTGFGTNTAFKPVGTTPFTAQTSLPSFGGIASNNNIATQGATLFGQQPQPAQAGLFQQAKPAFGAPATTAFGQQGTSLFGQQPAQQGTSLFGAPTTQPQQQGTSLFGQAPTAPTTSLFGQQPAVQPLAQPATTSLFGATQPAQTSLFGQQPAQQTTSIFGQQPAQQQTSLFGQPPQQTTSLFGQTAQPTTSLFGQPQQQQQAPSIFGAAQPATTSLFGSVPATTTPAQQTSLFTPAQPTSLFTPSPQPVAPSAPQMGFFNQPPSTFAQLANPLFQPQQNLDPSLQLLLPQLLLSYALNQTATQPLDGTIANPASELLNKLTTLVNQLNLNTNQNASNAAPSTPFDEFMKEARSDRLTQQKKETDNAYSLFSDFEKEPNYYLEFPSYPRHESKKREEPALTIQTIHKVPKKQESLLGSEKNMRQVSKKYRASQEDGKRKINAVLGDLPKIGNFSISPSLEKLKGYSSDQLRHVEHLRVWNQYGEVEFLEPVSLYRADLEAGIIISKDNIEITDGDLEDKRMRMTFRNFGNYVNLKGEERDKIVKKMRKWIAKYDMREINHDEHTGDLVVEVDN